MIPDPENRIRFGQIAKQLGDAYKTKPQIGLGKALTWYRRSLEVVGPVDSDAGRLTVFWSRVGLADALRMSGDPSEALAVLEACSNANVPIDALAEAYTVKASAQTDQKNFKDAAQTYCAELALRIKSKAKPVLLATTALRTAQAFNSMGNKVERDKYLKLAREYDLGDQECLNSAEKCNK